MITWYLWHNIILPSKDALHDVIILSLMIGIIVTLFFPAAYYDCSENHENAWIILTATIVFAFGFSIFIPLLIDVALAAFLISIPFVIFKIISFIVKIIGTTLERKYEMYISTEYR